MSTDYIDRDLINRKSPASARDSDPSTADLREKRAAGLRADQERLAALERETAATQALIEKQEAYETARAELSAALAAAQDRIVAEQDRSQKLLILLEESARDLQASQRLMDNLHEDEWTDATRSLELDHALATLDDIRVHYNDVAQRLQDARASAADAPDAPDFAPSSGLRSLFRSPHLRAGWAWALGAAIPLAAVILLLSIAWWIFLSLWW